MPMCIGMVAISRRVLGPKANVLYINSCPEKLSVARSRSPLDVPADQSGTFLPCASFAARASISFARPDDHFASRALLVARGHGPANDRHFGNNGHSRRQIGRAAGVPREESEPV